MTRERWTPFHPLENAGESMGHEVRLSEGGEGYLNPPVPTVEEEARPIGPSLGHITWAPVNVARPLHETLCPVG